MATVYEPVHRGVRSAVDPAFLEEGELVTAMNARYKNGDPALWQAEGRALCGGGGHGDGQPISSVASIAWDTNYPAAASHEIIWTDRASPSVLRVVAADVSPDSVGTRSGATNVNLPTSLGSSSVEAITLPDNSGHILLSGVAPIHLSRSGASMVARLAGVASNAGLIQAIAGGSGTQQNYYYWITYYDSFRDLESVAAYPARVYGYTNPSHILGLSVSAISERPTGVDYIRIYRSGGQTGSLPTPYPVGWRIGEVLISTLSGTLSGYTDTYEVLTDTTSSADLVTGTPYGFVTTSIGGAASTQVARDAVPPACITGDLYEGSLVVADKTKPIIYYSYPEKYHSFPATFYARFPVRGYDRPTGVRAVGRACIVLFKDSVWRLNWLPQQSDFDVSRGRIMDVLLEGIGCLNNASCPKFHMPGMGPMVAFASQRGIYATDGDQVIELTPGIDWQRTVSGDANVILVNNPTEYRLEFYYRDPNYARPEHGMYLHYHQSHLSDGRPAVTFVHRPGGIASATLVQTTDGAHRVMTTDYDDNILYEGIGFDDESSATPLSWEVRTREIYPGGLNASVAVKRLLCHAKSSSVGLDNFVVGVWKGPKQLGKFIWEEGGDRRLINKPFQVNTEYLQFAIAGTTADMPAAVALNVFGMEFDVMGEPNR